MYRTRFRLTTMLSLLVCCSPALAAPPDRTRELGPHVADRLARDIRPVTLMCAQPFENRGTFELPVRYSGAGASSDFIPEDRYLDIREVRASLRGQDLRAGDLGVRVSGADGWYDMRLVDDAIVWTADVDGPLYADRGTRIKFVAYRDDTTQAVTGDYLFRGCLVDSVPRRVTRPDIDVPRLPKKRLTPREPVESLPMRRPVIRTSD